VLEFYSGRSSISREKQKSALERDTNQGEGYTGVPLCTISGGGSGARCYAVIDPTKRAAAYQPAFGATPGWDMATGLGSVNAYNLVFDTAWK